MDFTSGVAPYSRILRFNSPYFNGGGLINDGGWWIRRLFRRDFPSDFFSKSVSANKINGPRLFTTKTSPLPINTSITLTNKFSVHELIYCSSKYEQLVSPEWKPTNEFEMERDTSMHTFGSAKISKREPLCDISTWPRLNFDRCKIFAIVEFFFPMSSSNGIDQSTKESKVHFFFFFSSSSRYA